ncbi:hypothetical protein MAR_007321 [Mya arenaria]|uniref:Uncharacterized protein n=1 Tax=Mya arenaria TaxID=6604 RepID=A0ABY7DIK9_MYAAR|nr:hypothetical protein MAR_007321 [Mya arenaria]
MAMPQKFKRKENWSRAEHEMLRLNAQETSPSSLVLHHTAKTATCSSFAVMSIYLQHSVSCNVPGVCHDSKKYNTNCSKSDKSFQDSIYKQLEKTS